MCIRRLQPTRDDCTVPVQWFSSVIGHSSKVCVSLHQFLMAAKPRHILTQTYRPENPILEQYSHGVLVTVDKCSE